MISMKMNCSSQKLEEDKIIQQMPFNGYKMPIIYNKRL